jgi:hypothetical protein
MLSVFLRQKKITSVQTTGAVCAAVVAVGPFESQKELSRILEIANFACRQRSCWSWSWIWGWS